MRVYGRRYEPIEADNEVFLSLIEEFVQDKANEVKYDHAGATEEQRQEAIKLYRKELIEDVLERLNTDEVDDDYSHIDFVDGRSYYDQDSRLGEFDYDDDGKRGVHMSLAHIVRVITKQKEAVWFSVYSYKLKYQDGSRSASFIMPELYARFRRTVRTDLGRIESLTIKDVEYYYDRLISGFTRWARHEDDYDPDNMEKKYIREIALQLPYQYKLIQRHKESEADWDYEAEFKGTF